MTVTISAAKALALGELLNTVPARSVAGPCPACHEREEMRVYEAAVVWACGHLKWLPPMGWPGRTGTRPRRKTS